MLNERALMEYNREANDNSIEIMKNLWLLILPDNELESLQSEYNLLPSETPEQQLIKQSHKGKNVLYDGGMYKVVFNMNTVGRNKQTQVALPAYYSILNNTDRFGVQNLTTSTTTNINSINSDLIYLDGNVLTLNKYPIDDVSSLKIKNIKNTIFTREVTSSEDDIDVIYSLDFAPLGSNYREATTKLVFRDMFSDSSDYFNTYFRDYFYTNFDSNYQMEMSFEQIIPNLNNGMLFNRQFYAYAKGGNFYFTQFSNSKLLSYGSKMWWTGDHFVFKKGVEDSINVDKVGRYFSMDYSTGEEGQDPTKSFLNIHLKGEYLGAKGGVDCFNVRDNSSTDYKLDRNLLFLGDYAKELDVMINNKLYFGQMGNWKMIDGERSYPASIYFNDDNREFAFKTPSSKFTYWFGNDTDTDDNVDSTVNNSLFQIKHKMSSNKEIIELTAYSQEKGENIPITIKNPTTSVDDNPKEIITTENLRYMIHTSPKNTKYVDIVDIIESEDVILGETIDGNYQNTLVIHNSTNVYSTSFTYVMLPQKPTHGEIVTIFINGSYRTSDNFVYTKVVVRAGATYFQDDYAEFSLDLSYEKNSHSFMYDANSKNHCWINI